MEHLIQAYREIRFLLIPFPPKAEQKIIVSIVKILDDKIELNRQMNTTLEAMAQALFKSWFVDFDPVIDKALAAGNPIPEPLHKRAEARRALGDKRKPLPADIAQHFSDRFRYSESLGWIPTEWDEFQFREFTTEVTAKVGEKNVPEYSSTNNGLVPRDKTFKKQLSKNKGKNKLI
ncbi:MAG: restriction endonuclease subunit S [Candidatus Electrothrix sp. GM3_4]|nr:restriction endonuclease subunit S [Candidatus Electrothrix sp. GM3_4]